MTRFYSAFLMAIIASTTTSRGVASGLTLVKHLNRPRSFRPTASLVSRNRFRSGRTTPFHRTASTCFIESDGATKENRGSTSALSAETIRMASASSADGVGDEIEQAARNSLSVTGSLPPPRNFGGLPYIDTSSITSKHAHRVLFVLGGPGAGKGTQSARIVDTYKSVHLSVGELLRAGAERADYEHADLVKECLVQGNIVPVEVSLGLLRIAMDEKKDDREYGSRLFLVDGFPRNFDNLEGWIKNMPSHAAVLGALVYNCPMDVLEKRIMTRAETSGRTDDNLDSARRRFATFCSQTEPVARALERVADLQVEENTEGSQLNVVNIDAVGTVEDVWKATEAAMDAYIKNDVLTANHNLLTAIEEGDIEASISNARVNINGVKATVTYDRKIKEEFMVREMREWAHGPKGWECVGVSREVLS